MVPQYDPSYGQPPMMPQQPPYDPNMGQAMPPQDPMLAQAQADLEALEAKKKAREEKEHKKEVQHVAHMMRSGQRNQEDNMSCANILVMWAILNGLMWAAPLL